MRVAVYGKLALFDPDKEDWVEYTVQKDFCNASQPTIRHVTSVPYHLASIGLAEIPIQTSNVLLKSSQKFP